MASLTGNRFVVNSLSNGVSPTGFTNNIDAPLLIRKCSDLFAQIAQGAISANVSISYLPVSSDAVVTFTGAGTNGDTLTIGNVTITLVTSGATGNQINIGGSATVTANHLVTFINASGSPLAGICTATNASGVITLTAAVPGAIGNGLNLAKSSSSITLTAGWGSNIVGSDGTIFTYSLGA